MEVNRAIFICVLLSLAAVQVCADTRLLTGYFLDQAPWTMSLKNECAGNPGNANNGLGWYGTDFQIPPYVAETGLVGTVCSATNGWFPPACAALGDDRTPIYAYGNGPSTKGTVRSGTSFYNWFHQSEQTFYIPYDVVMTQQGVTNIYGYENTAFFPLDGKGWKDSCAGAGGHNFGFCFQAHSRFGYSGGEVFNFFGDDDVFVYIDGRLVIDIGGIHSTLPGSVKLDDVAGLEVNKSYRFDFFYCERHTSGSDMKVQTTLDLYCSYTDICGVCEGNGGSCCNTTVIKTYCDDKSVCTVDTCNATVAPWDDPIKGCVHTSISCPAPTNPLCNISAGCDPINGCQYKANTCDDGDSCTIDSCDPKYGCRHDKIPCTSTQCKTSVCVAGQCVDTSTASRCDSSDHCKRGTCDPTNGCQTFSNASACNTNDRCKVGSCDSTSGCVSTPVVCNDNSKCTDDSCVAGVGCQYIPIRCEAPDLCSTAVCKNTTGCVISPISCDDGDGCTNDVCDPKAGCVHNRISCDDGNACTTDSCVSTSNSTYQCLNVTTDSNCLSCGATKCVNSASPCDVPYCDTTSVTCKTRPYLCTNANKCTSSQCVVNKDNKASCQSTAITCNTTDICNPMTCDPASGCVSKPVDCDDGNACTDDTCDSSSGSAVCKHAFRTCNSTACSPMVCNPKDGSCMVENAPSCDDENACTTDLCVVNGTGYNCTNTALVCGDACNPSTCVAGTCVDKPIVCTAPNLCSKATFHCVNGTPDCVIEALGSTFCDDANNCTNDFCNSSATVGSPCYHTNITCTPNICQTASCDPHAGCQFAPVICPGVNDRCKIASCDVTAGCIAENVVCAPTDSGCFVGMCNSTAGCYQVKRPDFAAANQYSHVDKGVLCTLKYDSKVKKAVIGAGATAGVVIGAVAAAGLIGFGGKKGYDFIQARNSGLGAVSSNPLYQDKPQDRENPLYVNR